MSEVLFKEYVDKSAGALRKAAEISAEFKGKDMPSAKIEEMQGFLAESKKFKGLADSVKEIAELEDFHTNPQFKAPVGGADDDTQRGIILDAKAKARGLFKSLGEQLQAVIRADSETAGRVVDERLLKVNKGGEEKAPTGMSEGVGSDGGWLVEEQYATGIMQRTIDTGILSRKAQVINVGPRAASFAWNSVDENSRVDASRFGGILVYRANEAATVSATKPKMKKDRVELEKLMGLIYLTEELLEDAVALESFINSQFPKAFDFRIDNEMFRGSGAGQIKGIIDAPCLVTVAKEVGQEADSLYSENVEKMFSRMLASSLQKAEWNINQDVWPQIFQLAHIIGTGGVPMYMMPAGLKEAPFGTLLGRPIVPIEHAATIGDLGDITFNDWSQFVLIKKGGIKGASSIHVKFVEGETALRFTLRLNGRPVDNAPLTPFQGSATQSSFVALAARA